jgi:hypothetical protein
MQNPLSAEAEASTAASRTSRAAMSSAAFFLHRRHLLRLQISNSILRIVTLFQQTVVAIIEKLINLNLLV